MIDGSGLQMGRRDDSIKIVLQTVNYHYTI